MLNTLRYYIATLLHPLPLCLIITFWGLLFLWFTSKSKTGKILVTIGTVLLTILSSDVSDYLIRSLERKYESLSLRPNMKLTAKNVVVLAGGCKIDESIPVTSQISKVTLARLIEGIRVMRINPESTLIVSGGGGTQGNTEADLMKRIAISLGISSEKILTETMSQNTHQQAVLLKPILKSEPFFLVTSASHMVRAMELFEKQGMNPIPVPSEYLVINTDAPKDFLERVPSSDKLKKSERAFYEYMGIAWAYYLGTI